MLERHGIHNKRAHDAGEVRRFEHDVVNVAGFLPRAADDGRREEGSDKKLMRRPHPRIVPQIALGGFATSGP